MSRRRIDNYETRVGARIRQLRTAHGLTLEQLARLIDMHPSNLARVEVGEALISAGRAHRIAETLGTDPALLFRDNVRFPRDLPALDAIAGCLPHMTKQATRSLVGVARAFAEQTKAA